MALTAQIVGCVNLHQYFLFADGKCMCCYLIILNKYILINIYSPKKTLHTPYIITQQAYIVIYSEKKIQFSY